MSQYWYWMIQSIILCIILSSGVSAELQEITSENNASINSTLQDTGKIPIGILVMQSGFVSDIGSEYERSFEMARLDHPDSPILPVVIDAGSNITIATEAWNTLKSEYPNLTVVVTVASWTTNVVYPKAAESDMVQLALGSAAVNRSLPLDRLVRFTPGVEQESPVLASYLDQFNRIVILGGDNDYSRGYAAALKSLIPDKIVHTIFYDPNRLPSTLNLSEVTARDPDAIVLLSVTEAGAVAEMIRGAHITVPLVGTRVLERNALLKNSAAEGLIFTTPALNESDSFFPRYKEKYGEDATFYGAEGFDAMNTLYSAVAECGDDSACLAAWYEDRTYNGSLGTVKFDKGRVASYPIELRIIRDGHFEQFEEMKAAP